MVLNLPSAAANTVHHVVVTSYLNFFFFFLLLHNWNLLLLWIIMEISVFSNCFRRPLWKGHETLEGVVIHRLRSTDLNSDLSHVDRGLNRIKKKKKVWLRHKYHPSPVTRYEAEFGKQRAAFRRYQVFTCLNFAELWENSFLFLIKFSVSVVSLF